MFFKWYVGKGIKLKDINEFYYTYASTTCPSEYCRYHFFVNEGKYYFEYSFKQGDSLNYQKPDVINQAKIEIDSTLWSYLYEILRDGYVVKRKEDIRSGGNGPWLYLYWRKDKKIYQQYSFDSYQKKLDFEKFCGNLVNK